MQRRRESNRNPRRKLKPPLDFLFHPRLVLSVEPVPLVDDHDETGPGMFSVADDMQILIDDALTRIDEKQRDVRTLQRIEGLDHREFLDCFRDPAFAPNARGVDDDIVHPITGKRHRDRVSGRARLIEYDLPRLTEKRIDERRFADVRTAHHRDRYPGRLRLGTGLRRIGNIGMTRQQPAQLAHSPAMRRRHQQHILEAESRELPNCRIRFSAVSFVGDDRDIRAPLAHGLRDRFVARCKADSGIDHQ